MPTSKSVVISSAGIGSRLGLGLTKALLQINGRSLISWLPTPFLKKCNLASADYYLSEYGNLSITQRLAWWIAKLLWNAKFKLTRSA